jgi:DNA transposition AAA+ family ATPase
MKNSFVETENYARFEAGLKALERRGANEANLMVVDGEPGLGKTTTLGRWATHSGALYLRAKKEWTPNWFLRDLLAEFRIPAPHSFAKGFGVALDTLMQRRTAAHLARRTFAVVVDEADHISRSADIVESIRDFSDVGDIPFILVGMGKIRDNLTRFPQVASRVGQYVRFDRASEQDVRALLDGLCEVPVADDLCGFVRSATGGYSREIKEAIVNVERFGKRNQNGEGNPVTLAQMGGQILVNDRRSGQPIHVPEAR